jgi:hypothetical protein
MGSGPERALHTNEHTPLRLKEVILVSGAHIRTPPWPFYTNVNSHTKKLFFRLFTEYRQNRCNHYHTLGDFSGSALSGPESSSGSVSATLHWDATICTLYILGSATKRWILQRLHHRTVFAKLKESVVK